MRLAYETAYSTACLFARTPVNFLALEYASLSLSLILSGDEITNTYTLTVSYNLHCL